MQRHADHVLHLWCPTTSRGTANLYKGHFQFPFFFSALDTEAGRKKWSMYNSIGLLLYDLERYDEAIEAYEKALEIESDQTAVLRNLAGVYFKLGNFSAAIPLLRISGTFDATFGFRV
jgi:tetratricopeptide (TPR) repeat protein